MNEWMNAVKAWNIVIDVEVIITVNTCNDGWVWSTSGSSWLRWLRCPKSDKHRCRYFVTLSASQTTGCFRHDDCDQRLQPASLEIQLGLQTNLGQYFTGVALGLGLVMLLNQRWLFTQLVCLYIIHSCRQCNRQTADNLLRRVKRFDYT